LLSSGPLYGLGEYSYFKGIILKIYFFDDVQLFYFSVKEEVVHGTKPTTYSYYVNKRQTISKGQLKMENREKLALQGIQDDDKQSKNTAQYVFGHHYAQANTHNVNKT